MDGLSVASSIAGLVSIAEIVISRLVLYVGAVKHAKEEISALLLQTSNLNGVLQSLKLLAEQYEIENPVYVQTHHINLCYKTLENLRSVLNKAFPSCYQKRYEEIRSKLHWPMTKSVASKFVLDLKEHKSTLSLALSADSFASLLKLLAGQDGITNAINNLGQESRTRFAQLEAYFANQERQKVLQYFENVSPTRSHATNLKLLQPGTGTWFLSCDEFRAWLDSDHTKLWIYGIPGAGKTILMALVIDRIRHEFPEDHVLAYYYCDYKNNDTQDPINILGSVAKQIARCDAKAFTLLEKYHRKISGDGDISRSTSAEDLRDVVINMTIDIPNVFLVIDGLDECASNRSNTVELLDSLNRPSCNNVRTLFASRDEHDIRAVLSKLVRVSIAAKSADLKMYVAAELQRRMDKGSLKLRNASLKEHIMERIVTKSEGMFRWAACQIDYICELHTDKQRRIALDSLPPTLPATYKRILSRVNDSPVETQQMVQRALMWIAYAGNPLSLAQLAEILSVEEGDDRIDSEAIVDGSAIMASCSSLVRISNSGNLQEDSRIEFSHFTVMEFLLGLGEDTKAEFRKFSLASEETAVRTIAKMCLTYLMMDDFSSNFPKTEAEASNLNKTYPFRSFATRWYDYRVYGLDESSVRLSHNLFNPAKSCNFMCWAQALASHNGCNGDRHDYLADSSTLHWACMIGDPSICSYLIELNENVNKWSRIGTPLHCAILCHRVLLDPNLAVERRFDLPFDVCLDRPKVIDLLLAASASIDTPYTPYSSSHPINSFSMFSLAYKYSLSDDDLSLVSALLRGGLVCDTSTLRLALSGNEGFLKDIKLQNLRPEDVTWFMNEYSELSKQSAPAITAEIKENVSNDRTSLEAVKALLMTAAEWGQDDVVSTVLEQGTVDVNERRSCDGNTPLHLCVRANHPRIVEKLLVAGADPLQCNADQKTSFHFAAQHSDGFIFQRLLDVTPDVDQLDCNGLTPLDEAACHGNTAVIAQLHEKLGDSGFRAIREASDGRSLSLCASQSGSIDTLELVTKLLGQSDIYKTSSDGSTALHYAAEAMSLPVMQYLLAKGLHTSASRADKSTPLHVVAGSAHAECSVKRVMMEVLFDHGANSDVRRADGATPLSLFCEFDQMNSEDDLDALSLLLETTSKLDLQDDQSRTPLHLLCNRLTCKDKSYASDPLQQMCAKAVCKLLESGADIAVRNYQNQSPFQAIFQYWNERRKYQNKDPVFSKLFELSLERGGKALVETVELQGKQLLSSVIKSGDTDLITALLDLHCDVDKRDRICEIGPVGSEGLDAVEQACYSGCPEKALLQILQLSRRPEIKGRTHNGLALLHLAVLGGSDDLVPTLLDHGANIDERISRGFYEGWIGATALSIAVWKRRNHIVDLLLSRSAKKLEVDKLGWTALHVGAYFDNLHAMLALQQESFPSLAKHRFNELHTASIEKLSPLHLAAAEGRSQIVNYILDVYSSSDINQRATFDFTALHMASRYGHTDTLKLLLSKNADRDAVNEMGYTSLHLAAIGGHNATAITLLEFGANAVRRTADGLDPEMIALQNGHRDLADMIRGFKEKMTVALVKPCTPESNPSSNHLEIQRPNALSATLFHAIRSGDIAVCERLLEAGAEANCHDGLFSCCTALVTALRLKKPKIAELLIHSGASNDPQMCDIPVSGETASPKGYSPLHYAAALGYPRVLGKLLQRHHHTSGTEVVTPLHLAAANGHLECAKVLINYHKEHMTARPGESSSKNGGHFLNAIIGPTKPSHSWRLTKVSQFPNGYGGTALHQAVAGKHEALVAYLIKEGIGVDLKNHQGWTALHVSASCGYVDLTRTLVSAGAGVECRAFNSWTPLLQAVSRGHVPVVLELASKRADLTLRDHYGRNSMNIALEFSQVDVVSCLMSFGFKILWSGHRTCSPLCSAILKSDSSLSLFLLDFLKSFPASCSSCRSLPILAFQRCHPFVVRRLLHKLKERRQRSATCDLIPQLSSALCFFSGYGRIDLMEGTLEAGANIDGFSEVQNTPLGVACELGQLNAVQFLIRNGAGTSWEDQDGRMVSAMNKAKGHQHVIEWLQGDHDNGLPLLESPRTTIDEIASSIGEPDAEAYHEISECEYAIFDSRPPSRYGIRRRKSYISEYVIRQRNSSPTSSSTIDNHTQRQPIWDSKDSREQHARTYCDAICKKRDTLPPLRYSSYPLFKQAHRVTSRGAWEIF